MKVLQRRLVTNEEALAILTSNYLQSDDEQADDNDSSDNSEPSVRDE